MRRKLKHISGTVLAALASALLFGTPALAGDGDLTGRLELTARGVTNSSDSFRRQSGPANPISTCSAMPG